MEEEAWSGRNFFRVVSRPGEGDALQNDETQIKEVSVLISQDCFWHRAHYWVVTLWARAPRTHPCPASEFAMCSEEADDESDTLGASLLLAGPIRPEGDNESFYILPRAKLERKAKKNNMWPGINFR